MQISATGNVTPAPAAIAAPAMHISFALKENICTLYLVDNIPVDLLVEG